MMKICELIPPSHILESKVSTDITVSGVTSDSRKVEKGGLFFAIKGSVVDGHSFLEKVANTVSAVLVDDRSYFDRFENAILLDSSRRTFAFCCHRWFGTPSHKLCLVGITGTNGKTTSAHLLEEVWRYSDFRSGRIGTVDYKIGDETRPSSLTTPDPYTLHDLLTTMLDKQVTHAVMEVSSIALEQDRVFASRFEGAIFTNLTQDHLDYHGNLEAYFQSKVKLFEELAPAVSAIYLDDEYGRRIYNALPSVRRVGFSARDPEADFFAKEIKIDRNGCTCLVQTPEKFLELKLKLLGRHNVLNALGVMAINYAMGMDVDHIADALAEAKGAPGRLEKVEVPANEPSVFVDYAHTPDALKNVLKLLGEIRDQTGGRVITVFGCGGDRDREKRPEMAAIASRLSDITIATSDNPRTEDPEQILNDAEEGILRNETTYIRQVDRRTAIHKALETANADDYVLIAGKGHETYQILGTEKIDFDDREVVREYY